MRFKRLLYSVRERHYPTPKNRLQAILCGQKTKTNKNILFEESKAATAADFLNILCIFFYIFLYKDGLFYENIWCELREH